MFLIFISWNIHYNVITCNRTGQSKGNCLKPNHKAWTKRTFLSPNLESPWRHIHTYCQTFLIAWNLPSKSYCSMVLIPQHLPSNRHCQISWLIEICPATYDDTSAEWLKSTHPLMMSDFMIGWYLSSNKCCQISWLYPDNEEQPCNSTRLWYNLGAWIMVCSSPHYQINEPIS